MRFVFRCFVVFSEMNVEEVGADMDVMLLMMMSCNSNRAVLLSIFYERD